MFKNDFDYRADYFKKHKGIFGIYFCSYCGKPLTKGKNTHVDHIIPKSKNQYMLNRSFNTTIACAKCNLKKSDKMDHRIVQGYASKIGGGLVGGALGLIFKVVSIPLQVIGKILAFVLNNSFQAVGWVISKSLSTIWNTIVAVLQTVFRFLFSNLLITGLLIFLAYLKLKG